MANRQSRNRARSGRGPRAPAAPRGSLQFSRVNALLGIGGVVCLTVGYWFLAQGSVTLAPLLLVLGYVVLLPLAIVL